MAAIDQYRKPEDLPAQIPVFPLRGAILLPRATLPLSIFEPRYLAMIDDVMSGGRVLGIIQPTGNDTEDESPEGKDVKLRNVGCAGRVTHYQELDDGRFGITLTGVARFTVATEIESSEPYRIVDACYDAFADDLTHDLGEEDVDREHLLKVLKTYLEANRLQADWNSILRASSESLINALSIMSPYGPEEKQALLEARDLKSRAEVLVALAEMELASGGGAGGTLQ